MPTRTWTPYMIELLIWEAIWITTSWHQKQAWYLQVNSAALASTGITLWATYHRELWTTLELVDDKQTTTSKANMSQMLCCKVQQPMIWISKARTSWCSRIWTITRTSKEDLIPSLVILEVDLCQFSNISSSTSSTTPSQCHLHQTKSNTTLTILKYRTIHPLKTSSPTRSHPSHSTDSEVPSVLIHLHTILTITATTPPLPSSKLLKKHVVLKISKSIIQWEIRPSQEKEKEDILKVQSDQDPEVLRRSSIMHKWDKCSAFLRRWQGHQVQNKERNWMNAWKWWTRCRGRSKSTRIGANLKTNKLICTMSCL